MEDARPRIRHDDLVVQELNGEILVYDLKRDKAFCLNETASLVWQACDGSKTIADIGKMLDSEDAAWLALNDLKKHRLIEQAIATPEKFQGLSRREVLSKIVTGSILALPMISALYAPAAAQAAGSTENSGSTCGMICQKNSDCELSRGGMVEAWVRRIVRSAPARWAAS